MGEEGDLLDVRFFTPPDHLAPYISSIYRLDVRLEPGQTVSDYLQPEWANLRYFSPYGPKAKISTGHSIDKVQFQASGPTSLPVHFTLEGTRLWGIGLLPLGWATFVGVPAHEYANWLGDGDKAQPWERHRPLHGLLFNGERDDAKQFATITSHFDNLLFEHPDKQRILAIHETMVDPYLVQVSEFAERLGMATRTLERVCCKHFGFTPSILLRRQRLMRTLAAFMLEERATWTQVIDRHYHDQSHFVREFHTFMEMSPGEYARLDHPILGAFMQERQRIWGSPVQTMDRPSIENGSRGVAEE